MRRPDDWSEDVKKLTIPVMLVYGDSDRFRPEHIVELPDLLDCQAWPVVHGTIRNGRVSHATPCCMRLAPTFRT